MGTLLLHRNSPNVSRTLRVHRHMNELMTRHLWLLTIAPIGFLAAVSASAQDAVPILERAADRYASLSGFCADFEQRIDVTLLQEVKESRGELCQMRPDHFEMRFSDPEGDRIVADGVDLWVYFPSTDEGQVFRTPLAGTESRFDLHREFLLDPGMRYLAASEGRETIDGKETHVLLLTPRVRSPYVRVRIWIGVDDNLIRRLEILEDSESIRTLDLTNMRIDPGVAPDWFHFDPPSDIQVITR
jgi:outer membrane lipoprotein carrier protein